MNGCPMKKTGKSRAAPLSHRSPVPPTGGPMGKKGYDRPAARKDARRAAEDAAASKRPSPHLPLKPIELEEQSRDESPGGEEE